MNAIAPSLKRFEAVRQLVADRIENDAPHPAAWKLRAALDRHFHKDWEMAWMEVSILFDCHRRERPARAHRMLAQLRAMRTASGERDRFDSFLDRVTRMLAPDTLTPHGYNRTFSGLASDEIFGAMGKAIAPLAKLGRPTLLFAGSLLGYRRNGRLIEHDDDIDVGIHLGECTRAEVGHRWKAYKLELEKAGLLEEDEAAQSRVVLKMHTALPVEVDLFPSWTEDGRFSIYPYSNAELPAEAIFPLQSFDQDPLMLPTDPDALLVQSYGKNWRVPDPLFHLNWGDKKRAFSFLVDVDYALKT